jgi:hypothetical protein
MGETFVERRSIDPRLGDDRGDVLAGVTSKDGLRTCAPRGELVLPTWVTSRGALSSIGIASPFFVERSIVDHGAAT